MNTILALLGAGSGGVLVAFGAALNARLRQTLHSAIAAATINFMTGFATLTLLIVLQVMPIPTLDRLLTIPWWMFLGGLLGAVFVTLSTVVVPKLGLTTTTLAVVCSQMVVSLVIDQLGWFNMAPRPINATRIIAITLLVMAIALTQLDRHAHATVPAIAPQQD